MKVKIDKNFSEVEANRVRIETENFIFDITICHITGNLHITKVVGKENMAIKVMPIVVNVIELE